jgi:ActR/RegA family two-component response regulator
MAACCVAQKTVLILDDDLGFSMWLGRALNEANIGTLPASKAEEALAIVMDESFPRIDLMIVNFNLEGWREVLDAVAAQGGNCKVISIGPSGQRAVDGKLRRPSQKSLPRAERYVKIVRDVLWGEFERNSP